LTLDLNNANYNSIVYPNRKGDKMVGNENIDKIQCRKCKGMMVPTVVKEGCGGNRTERVCPLCGKVLSKKGMACCFIATAAYGSSLNEKVNILSSFRDQHLLNYRLGQNFVSFYYAHSPKIATRIECSEHLKLLVRFFLYPIVFVAERIIKQ